MPDPELIWLRPERGTRGPAPTHSRAEIARVAVELADAEGLAGVSMRKIAGALGTGPMSLYNYVPGKEQLYDLMVDEVAAEWKPPRQPPGDPRTDLAEFARQGVAILRRHPWLPALASARLTIGPNSLHQLEYFLGILSDVDVPAIAKLELFGLMNGFLSTFAQFEANQRDAAELQADITRFLTKAAATGDYPNLVAAFAKPRPAPARGQDTTFERILPRLLTLILGPGDG
jgi:AcrR family transcriptional regulator